MRVALTEGLGSSLVDNNGRCFMPRDTWALRSALRDGVVATGSAFRRAAPDELTETEDGKRCRSGRPVPCPLRCAAGW